MGSKQNSFYFDNFIACADYSRKAAQLLDKGMRQFDPAQIGDMIEEMHEVEHAGDEKKHELLNVLAKAFITPIEREDIILLGQNIDEVTDKIEDVLLRMYCNNIKSVRPDALELVAVVIECCNELKEMLEEFPRFKNSKKLHEKIVNINTLEEKADQLFISSMRNLHTTCDDPVMIIVWREIYIYLEKCVDACEHVADTVESVIMKNS
ncbi:MAG TPA: DUF47 family protein [Candidatus Fimisoma avicola]|uniref:DUF47 family protein n=1 Tax=Candidatus Fimisoma avicola TaxID=2840826 RepID=A0A9D1I2T9_9FIRM|nr:DUF47 family protein [Candidatus Fimisoma avicola]